MFGLGKKKYVVMAANDSDHGRIAELHVQSFPRGWSKSEIAKLAAQGTVTLLVARPVGAPKAPAAGFNLIRQTADEAEILSVAVDPKLRHIGLGDAMMREAIRHLQSDRIPTLFLEVDGTNVPAVSLYQKLGFQTVGSRPGYYKKHEDDEKSERATALVMRLDLV